MNILFGLLQPDEGEIFINGRSGDIAQPGGGDRGRYRHGTPALQAGSFAYGRRERLPRHGNCQERPDRPRRTGREDARPVEAVRPVGRPYRARRPAVGRHRAADRDPQGAGARCPHHHPRRTDCRAHAAGKPRAFSDIARLRRPGHDGHLHFAPPRRGDGGVRHGDRPPPRQGGGDASDGEPEEVRARADDGRPLGEFRPPSAPTVQPASPCCRCAISGRATSAGCRRCAGVSFDVRAGEIVGIAGVAGNGQTELAEVIAGLRPASHGSIALDGKSIVGRSAREIRAVRCRPCAR